MKPLLPNSYPQLFFTLNASGFCPTITIACPSFFPFLSAPPLSKISFINVPVGDALKKFFKFFH